MRKSRRRSAALAIAAVAALLPAGTASAVSTGDMPPPRHHWTSSWGHIQICKKGIDTFDVYADGQGKTWQWSLDEGPKTCTRWGAMRPGEYDIAFAQRVASQQHVVILATYRDSNGKFCRKVFHGQGVLNSLLLPGKTIRIYLLLKRSHHSVV